MFPLPIRVLIAPGADLTADPATWTWTDITSYARPRITITRGRPDESGQAPPGSCRLRVKNPDGAFVARNPMGPWYPLLRRNCPLRVEVQVAGVWHTRSTMFIDELPVTFVPGSDDTYVDLVASGITRRLGQGSAPVVSTPVRYIPTTNPVAYWPLEDGQLASEGAALVGGQPMRPFVGTHPAGNVVTFARWGRGDLAPWLPGAVSRTGNAGLTAIWAPVSMPTAGRWVVDLMYRSGTDAADATVDVNPSYLRGSLGWPQLYFGPSFQGLLVAMNGEPEVSGTATALYDGLPHHVRWDVFQNGAKVSWNVYVDAVMVNFGTTSGNMTLPSINALALTADAQAGADMVQGHVAVWTTPPPLADAVAAAFGYAGEAAADRMVRLCAEASVPFVVAGSDSEAMGPQAPAPLLNLLREAEATDGGILYERIDGRLGYLRRTDRYNRPTDLALTYSQLAGSFLPTDDDRFVRNDVTVTRTGGSAPAQATDQDHINREGRYDDQATINTQTDAVLPNHAGWRVHLGTVDELRHPLLTLNLRNPRVTSVAVAAWLDSDIGSRLTVADPPRELALTQVDQVIEGYDELLDRLEWSAGMHCSPASGWDVATVDGSQRVAAEGSGLATGLGASATSLLLTSTIDNGPWTEDIGDLPLDLRVGGERVTVDGALRASDPFTRTVSNSWGVEPGTGQSWQHFGSAASFATTGSVAQHIHQTVNSGRISVIDLGSTDARVRVTGSAPVVALGAGTALTIYAIARFTDDNNFYQARLGFIPDLNITCSIRRRVAGVDTTLSSIVTGLTHVAGTRYTVELDVTGSTLFARVWREGDPVPAWQTSATDTALTVGTKAGVRTIIDAGSGNTMPLTYTIDDFSAAAPAIRPAVSDAFTRSTSGFGTATSGQVWATSGGSAGDYTTDTARGVISQGTVGVLRIAYMDIGSADATWEIDAPLMPTPTGAASTYWLLGRIVDMSNHYIARLDVAPGGSTQLALFKRVGGALTGLGSPVALSPNIGGTWRLGLSVHGTGEVRAKAYRLGTDSDRGWLLTATDTGYLTTAAGTGIGVAARLESGNTSTLPVLARWDNLLATSPQAVNLSARAVNGIARAWPAGTEVDVWQPAITAL